MTDGPQAGDSEVPRSFWKPALVVGGIVLLLWSGSLVLTLCFAGKPANAVEFGQIGDAFGAVNALFSGLALAGVIAALVMQNREIDLQRRDLRATLDAQLASAEAAREQAELQAHALQTDSRALLLRGHLALVEMLQSDHGREMYNRLPADFRSQHPPTRIVQELVELLSQTQRYHEQRISPLADTAVAERREGQ